MIQDIQIISNVLSSIVHIGDTVNIKSRANILAVQRQIPYYLGKEGDLSQFPIFSRSISQASPPKEVKRTTLNKSSTIQVNTIKIIGLSSSALFQVGSSENIELDSRIKHIRQFVET